MSLLSKRNCQSYYKQFIIPNISRITYLHLWNPFNISIVYESLNNIVLRISTSDDIAYLNANRWQQLILSDIVHLRIFDIEHSYNLKDHNNQTIFSSLIKQFTSPFWIERGWYFANQYPSRDGLNCGIFYSIRSRRRRDYILSSEKDQKNDSNHVTSDFHLVHHVHIQNQSAMDNCSIYFPNADELTVSVDEYISHDSTIVILNRILPLNKLNKIIINSEHFPFDIVVKILSFTPNCSKLILHSLLLNENDRTSLKNEPTFRVISNK
ncbi:unnamed protein product [Rotaria sordida]|nr:unnamed protein product [Rotaria sordida]